MAPDLLLALAVAVLTPTGPPQVKVGSSGFVVATLPPVLGQDAVRKHLTTGLTTTLVLEVELRRTSGASVAGAAQVGVRLDLWEETYLLTVTDLRGTARMELRGDDALRTWWSTASLTVAQAPSAGVEPAVATVRLTVLPFSRAEEEDTRAWFLRSLQRSDSPPPPERNDGKPTPPETPGTTTVEPAGGLKGIYDALIATSIGRRSLLTYTWQVPVSAVAR